MKPNTGYEVKIYVSKYNKKINAGSKMLGKVGSVPETLECERHYFFLKAPRIGLNIKHGLR